MYPFLNRELSWLDFNTRVLAEAENHANLPLDRLHFLSITSSNLDEFYMVRISCLHDQTKSKYKAETMESSQTQLEQVLRKAQAFQQQQSLCLEEILKILQCHEIHFPEMEQLTDTQLKYSNQLFCQEVLPVITPLAVDPSRPFPFLSNKSLNIGVRLHNRHGENSYAVIQVPSILPRFLRLPGEGTHLFLPLERLIMYHLPEICNMYEIKARGLFRITRSADFDADEDTDNLMEEMIRTIRKRKRGKPIRLELSKGFDPELRSFLEKMLGIPKRYVLEIPGFIDLTALSPIVSLDDLRHLKQAPVSPVIASDFVGCEDIFCAIRERDRMVHHPYQTFDHVIDFIYAAARDPNVLAIKQTLYRVSGESRVIKALEQAAESGKQVTVLVELKARFDEENNIQWAKRLERAGCHVIYGLTGLKTHCKITLVIRREPEGIRRYVHLGTGNYNDVTAKVYTDIGLFTCRQCFGDDASALFNHLTGFSDPPQYQKLVVAPASMKPWFLEQIEREIQNARQQLPCGISFKMNSLLDRDLIRKLWEASEAGVPIRLVIRGICGLLPGKHPFSSTIRIRSIVGRFLEHSRIYLFENAGDPQIYAGSADLMPRNLERRVETLFPIEEPILKYRLESLLELFWEDTAKAWELHPDGVYYPTGNDNTDQRSDIQQRILELAEEELQQAEFMYF